MLIWTPVDWSFWLWSQFWKIALQIKNNYLILNGFQIPDLTQKLFSTKRRDEAERRCPGDASRGRRRRRRRRRETIGRWRRQADEFLFFGRIRWARPEFFQFHTLFLDTATIALLRWHFHDSRSKLVLVIWQRRRYKAAPCGIEIQIVWFDNAVCSVQCSYCSASITAAIFSVYSITNLFRAQLVNFGWKIDIDRKVVGSVPAARTFLF